MNIVKISSNSKKKSRTNPTTENIIQNVRKMFGINDSNEARKIPFKTTSECFHVKFYHGFFLSKLK